MSSLGQLVAGIAHEINNPVNFIYGNLSPASEYAQDLLKLAEICQKHLPSLPDEIREYIQQVDLNFLQTDLPKLIASMGVGADRIRQIVLSLRNFSRLDEAEMKSVDIHEGIESTLLILQNRLKGKPEQSEIQIVKNYGDLPAVECYAGKLNQVFMNIISNAIDALDSQVSLQSPADNRENPGKITITTAVKNQNWVLIHIADNGPGMTEAIKTQLFNPFFTTKPPGKGTGLGMSISHQIVVENHKGIFWCKSEPGKGAEFYIEIPISPEHENQVEETTKYLTGIA
jgi:signal transduction histidine kinase